eukprot:3752003-Amphidinium_carterae.1
MTYVYDSYKTWMTTYNPSTTRTSGTSENAMKQNDQNRHSGRDSSTKITRRRWTCQHELEKHEIDRRDEKRENVEDSKDHFKN